MFPLFLFLFLGHEARFFGRWLHARLPGARACSPATPSGSPPSSCARRAPGCGALVVLVVVLCAQGLASSVHLDRVLGREDTRALAKRWLEDNVPARAGVVVEPFVPG